MNGTLDRVASDRGPRALTDSLYRRHREGALVRSAASLLMWITAIPALQAGILDGPRFRGVTLAVAFLVAMNLPLLWIAIRIRSHGAYEILSIAVHACEILGYTAIIHFVGGLDAAFLTLIYCGLIVYIGVVAPRRHLFLVAGMSALAFTLLVLLEHSRVLPDYPLFGGLPGAHPSWSAVSVILGAVAALLFVVAGISGRTASLLKASRERLRLQADELQREIEARVASEAQLRLLVAEKEILLQEVHHRVKNNLQMISSLLKLQAGAMSDDSTRIALMASHGRVNSMAMVHEMFYRSGNLHRVDLEPFLRSLTAHLASAYDLGERPLEVQVVADHVTVTLDTAIRVGLVVNELVSNALKHAFPEPDAKGRIHVVMRVDSDLVELSVADDGCGLPEGFDWGRTDSLGLQIVHSLARQLHGTISTDGTRGTAVTLRFPTGDSGEQA
jgi:two-component sensor histidine kinase